MLGAEEGGQGGDRPAVFTDPDGNAVGLLGA